MHAVRNIKLCTKDCLCLYVCPTGATDTEDGQIDKNKCLSGCRLCVDACASNAISLISDEYPPQQLKSKEVVNTLYALAKSKTRQEKIALNYASKEQDPLKKQLAEAIGKSNRIMAEDLLREAGFMLPQSENVEMLLQSLLDGPKDSDFPIDDVKKLLASIKTARYDVVL